MDEQEKAPVNEEVNAAPAPAEGGEESPRPRMDRGPRPDRGDRGDRGGDRGGRGGPRRRFPRRKVCYFRTIKAEYIDYKDVDTLRRFISDKGKIVPRRVTGTSAKFQRALAVAIKRARYMAFIPYSGAHK